MLLKLFRRESLVLLTLGIALVCGAKFPELCAECEEEIWEEVPCSQVPSSTPPPIITTTQAPTTMPPIITTTMAPPTTMPVPMPSPIPPTLPPTLPPIYTPVSSIPTPIDNSASFNKCYCECKLGCKEFCRKVVVSGPKQQITQISSTANDITGAQLEYTHVHQRKYYPNSQLPSAYAEASSLPYPLRSSSKYSDSVPLTQPLIQPVQQPPLPRPLPLPLPLPLPMLSSDSYSIDEITKLFEADKREYKNTIPTLPQYYTPYGLAPMYSNVADVSPSNAPARSSAMASASVQPSNFANTACNNGNCVANQERPTALSNSFPSYPLTYSDSLSGKPMNSFDYAIENYLKDFVIGVSGQDYNPYDNY